MGREIFNEGEEIVRQDHNALQALIEKEYNDDVLYRLFGGADGFIANSFKVVFNTPTQVDITDGRGFQYDNTQVDPEPKYRGIDLDAITPQAINAADPTNPRVDIICVKSTRVVTSTALRKYKATPVSAITNVTFDKSDKYSCDIQYIAGTPAPSPVTPSTPAGYIKIATISVPAVTGPTSQGNITDNRPLLQVATALGVGVNTLGKTALTTLGANTPIQTVIDEIDPYIKNTNDDLITLSTDLADAVNPAKGAGQIGLKVATNANWNVVPTNPKAALDELAGRTEVLENTASTGTFIQENMDDFVKAPTVNTGLTDNANTNPRGLKFNDLKYIEGEEIVAAHAINPTGNYDANGLPEYEIVSPRKDPRIRFYGNWLNTVHDQNGARPYSQGDSGELSYILITGVFDSLALECGTEASAQANDLDVLVDGVDTGTNLSMRQSNALYNGNAYSRPGKAIFSHSTLKNLGMDLHTVKIVNASTDANRNFSFYGCRFIASGRMQLGGDAYVNKVSQNYAQSTPAAPSVNNKGGKVVRYIDPTDQLLKFAVQNCKTVITSITGSLGSGSGSAVVNSATGFQAGDIALITDGPNNSELIRITGVNIGLNTLTFATNTQNSYTNPSVEHYGSTIVSANHSNEEVYHSRTPKGYGDGAAVGAGSDINQLSNGAPGGYTGCAADLAHHLASSSAGWTENSGAGYFKSGIYPTGSGQVIRLEFVGTGLDLEYWQAAPAGGNPTFVLDGVELAAYTTSDGIRKWIKLCSDLPEGSHVLHIEVSAAVNWAISEIKVYRTKQPALTGGAKAGNIIASKWKTGSYLHLFAAVGTNSKPALAISRGVITQALHAGVELVEGSSGSQPWIIAQSYPASYTVLTTPDIPYIYTNKTGAILRRWFKGTGIDVAGFLSADRGIWQVKIDGTNATTANFPGATFHSNSGNFVAASGQWDQYTGGGDTTDVLGISGLTDDWHSLELEQTGTKNVSSSDYFGIFQAVYIHGLDFDFEVPRGTVNVAFAPIGALKDQRILDPIRQLEFAQPNVYQRSPLIGTPGIGSAGLFRMAEMHVHCETKENEWLDISFWCRLQNSVAGGVSDLELYIDGTRVIYEIGQSGIYTNAANINYQQTPAMKLIYPVSPGYHLVEMYWSRNTGTTASDSYGRRMIVKPVPALKGA